MPERILPRPVHPARSAEATVRGYLSQVLRTVQRWMDLQEDQLLICEGDEDIDTVLYREGRVASVTLEQVKELVGKISARDVHESVFNFLVTFAARAAEPFDCRFVFTTTATLAAQQTARTGDPDGLTVDILKEWRQLSQVGGEARPAMVGRLAENIRRLYRTYVAAPLEADEAVPRMRRRKAKAAYCRRIAQAIAFMDGGTDLDRWSRFLLAVEWQVGATHVEQERGNLLERIQRDQRCQHLPHRLLADRLLLEALAASARNERGLRVLEPCTLRDVLNHTEAELRHWTDRTDAARLEQHIASLQLFVSQEEQQQRLVRHVALTLDSPEAISEQVSRLDELYFRSRVVPGLFIEPYQFSQRYRAFVAGADQATSAAAFLVSAKKALGHLWPPSLRSSRESAVLEHLEQCLIHLTSRRLGDRFHTVLGALRLLLQDFKLRQQSGHRRGFRLLPHPLATGPRPMAEPGRTRPPVRSKARRIIRILVRVQRLLPSLLEMGAPLRFVVAPAGRGKSNYVWETVQRLRTEGHSVCVISGRELRADMEVGQIVLKELKESSGEDSLLFEAIAYRWAHTGRPFFVLLDAVNEASVDPGTVINQIARFCSQVNRTPGMRGLIACRDQFWPALRSGLGSVLESADVQDPTSIRPTLDAEAVGRYLRHFSVQGVRPDSFHGDDWRQNPLLLRVFCETYKGSVYKGSVPTRLNSITLLKDFFARKQAELVGLGYHTLDLEAELTGLGAELLCAGRPGQNSAGTAQFVVTRRRAEGLLNRPGQPKPLLETLQDMDLILQANISPNQPYVAFAIERIQDYFVAKAVLLHLEEAAATVSDRALEPFASVPACTPGALGMLVALALHQNQVDHLKQLEGTVARVLAEVLDLVPLSTLRRLRPQLQAAARMPSGLHQLGTYLWRQTSWTEEGRRHSRFTVFVLSLYADLVFSMPPAERYGRVYTDSWLHSLTARAANDLHPLRQWAAGSQPFPRWIRTDSGSLRTVAIGLASPVIGGIAHEWLYWVGVRFPQRTTGVITALLSDPDPAIRVRCVALLYAWFCRMPAVRSAGPLLQVYKTVLDRTSPSYSDHYWLREFARLLLMHCAGLVQDQLPPEAWTAIEAPPRRQVSDGALPSREAVAAHGDREGYRAVVIELVNGQFQWFPDRAKACGEILDLLERESYRMIDEGRLWVGTLVQVVLGRWADSHPISAGLADPAAPFALCRPAFRYLFNVAGHSADRSPAPDLLGPLDSNANTPETFFPGEVPVWGFVRSTALGAGPTVHFRCGLTAGDAGPVGVQVVVRRGLGGFRLHEDLVDEDADPDDPSTGCSSPLTIGELACPVVAAYAEYGADPTANQSGYFTLSPRLVATCNLIPGHLVGSFHDRSGRRVVRCLKWTAEDSTGHLVLMDQKVLLQACERLGLSPVLYMVTE